MPATIYDVARKAGVGIGTVSRIINNSPQISPKTREKVLKTIKELNYQPHALARGLARKKTNIIAAIVPFFTSYFFMEVLRGVQKGISQYQYDLVLYSVDHIEKTDMFLKRTLSEQMVEGVLLISLHISDEYVDKFLTNNLPIVLVDSFHPQIDSISVKNEQGAYEATRHLIEHGHRRIAMINGHLISLPAHVRLKGYQRALSEYNIPFDKKYLMICDFIEEADGFTRKAGYEGMCRLLKLGKDRPTAVFVSSDIQAVGAIKAIQERGMNIPRDIAIVSFDDIELAKYFGLTTMHQPLFEIGKLAIERLVEKISGSKNTVFQKNFSTHLVVRESCGVMKI